MNQVPAKNSQTPVFYNADYINSLFEQSGLTKQRLAHVAEHSPTTVDLVLNGKATKFPAVYDVIAALNGSYECAFMGLSTFRNHRAVEPNGKSGGGAVNGRPDCGGHGRSRHR